MTALSLNEACALEGDATLKKVVKTTTLQFYLVKKKKLGDECRKMIG